MRERLQDTLFPTTFSQGQPTLLFVCLLFFSHPFTLSSQGPLHCPSSLLWPLPDQMTQVTLSFLCLQELITVQETDVFLEHLQGLPVTGLIGYLLVSSLLLVPILMQKFWRDTKVPAHLYRRNPRGYQ